MNAYTLETYFGWFLVGLGAVATVLLGIGYVLSPKGDK